MNPTELSTKESLKKGPDLSEYSIHKQPVDTKTRMPTEATKGNDDAAPQAKGSSLDGPAGAILELLKSLEKKLPRTQKKKITSELQNWVRLLEAGSSGEHAKEYELVKSAVRGNSEVMGRFVDFTRSVSPEIRTFALTLIAKLFPKGKALEVHSSALTVEPEPVVASLMAWSLARMDRGNPRTCDLIGKTHDRFIKNEDVNYQIAGAWGLAGCQQAAPFLVKHLSDGGYDRKKVALDGLRGLERIEDLSLQQRIAEVLASSNSEEIGRACVEVMGRFESILPSTTEFLLTAAKKKDGDRNGYVTEALKALSADPWVRSSHAPDPKGPDNEIELPMADAFISHFDSDLPLGDNAVDCINVEDEARAFARIAASKDVSPPLAIGIFGEWGSGKTFFMEKIHANVEELSRIESDDGTTLPFCSQIVQIRFNAWHYMESNLWASLVDYIFQELDLWLHRKKTHQNDINNLFDKLNTARALKLESVRAVIKARKERVLAAKRLVDIRSAYENAMEKKLDLSSDSFWKAVLGTFCAVLKDSDKESLKSVSHRLGIGQLIESVETFQTTMEEAADQAGRIRLLFRAIVSRLGQGKALLALISLLILLPLGLAGMRAFLAQAANMQWLNNINDLTVGIVGMATAVTSVVGFLSNQAARALNTLQTYRDQMDAAVKSENEKTEREVAKAQQEVEAKRAELEQAEQNLINADMRKQAAEQEWTDTSPRGRLNRFIREKAVGGDYAKHLGIVAAIRKDFGQLSKMMSQEKADASLQQLYNDAEDEYLAEVKRIIAEASDGGGTRSVLSEKEIDDLKKSTAGNPPEMESFERIILYIDDLDRCPPDKVVCVLQAIHLLLCFNLFVVVVAVDARWISRALIKQYPDLLEENVMWVQPKEGNGEKPAPGNQRVGASSHDYLEKIFQIPYWVRPMDAEACTKYVAHLTTKDQLLVKETASADKAPLDGARQGSAETKAPNQADAGGDTNEASPRNSQGGTHAHLNATEEKGEEIPATPMDPFGGMYLTKYEIEMLENLAPFAGSSPRRGLRFVNVYRLIKSSFKSGQLMEMVDTKGEKLGYRALITQLAISTGAPKIAQYYFQLIIGKIAQISSLEELLNQLGQEPRITTSPEWLHLRGALDKLKELNENGNLGVGSDMILALGLYAPIARRYSFTARPV